MFDNCESFKAKCRNFYDFIPPPTNHLPLPQPETAEGGESLIMQNLLFQAHRRTNKLF